MTNMEKAIAFLQTDFPPEGATLHQARAWVDGLGKGGAYPLGVSAPEYIEDYRLYRVDPSDSEKDHAFLYFHGGGYVAGSILSHGPLVATLALEAGMPVYFLDHRRPPEYPCPAAIDDAIRAYDYLTGQGYAVSVGGDSAGSGLAVAVALIQRERGDAPPKSIVALSPWVDLTLDAGYHSSTVDDPMVSVDALVQGATAYRGHLPLDDFRISPGLQDLSGLPPLLIQIGTREHLRQDAKAFGLRAIEAGVETHYHEWQGMIHVWPLYGDYLPEGRQALAEAARHVRIAHGLL